MALLLLLLLQLAGGAVAGGRTHGQEAIIASCIARASGGRDWLAKTLWGLRDQEGGWVGAEVLNLNGSHDLGPMQVNSRWVAHLAARLDRSPQQVRHWLVHDACFNVDAARWIFVTGLSAAHDFWRAVGIYHSPTVARQRLYSHGVARKLRDRFGPAVFRERSGDEDR